MTAIERFEQYEKLRADMQLSGLSVVQIAVGAKCAESTVRGILNDTDSPGLYCTRPPVAQQKIRAFLDGQDMGGFAEEGRLRPLLPYETDPLLALARGAQCVADAARNLHRDRSLGDPEKLAAAQAEYDAALHMAGTVGLRLCQTPDQS